MYPSFLMPSFINKLQNLTHSNMSNFPDSPSLNEVYISENGTTYTWDGEKWTAPGNGSSGGGGSVAPPAPPVLPTLQSEVIQNIVDPQLSLPPFTRYHLCTIYVEDCVRVYCRLNVKWDPSESTNKVYAYDEFNIIRSGNFGSEIRSRYVDLPKGTELLEPVGTQNYSQTDPLKSNLIVKTAALKFEYTSRGRVESTRQWDFFINNNSTQRLVGVIADFITFIDAGPNIKPAVYPPGTTDFVNTDPI